LVIRRNLRNFAKSYILSSSAQTCWRSQAIYEQGDYRHTGNCEHFDIYGTINLSWQGHLDKERTLFSIGYLLLSRLDSTIQHHKAVGVFIQTLKPGASQVKDQRAMFKAEEYQNDIV